MIDAVLIGAAHRVDDYEVAAYGAVRANPEEGAADKKLTSIADDDVVLTLAARAGEDEEELAEADGAAFFAIL